MEVINPKTQECYMGCGNMADAFWPVRIPFITPRPYCNDCLAEEEKRDAEILADINKIIKENKNYG